SGFFGSTVMHPSEYGPSSKIGWKVTPRFTVFHRPPLAVATYHTFRLRPSTATSAIRPEENVPWIFRTGISFTVSEVSGGVEPCCAIVEGGGSGQDSRLGLGRRGIEIVSGGQPPAGRAGPHKAVIAQVVVGVGNQDAEHNSPPQGVDILFRRGSVLAEDIHEFQVAA